MTLLFFQDLHGAAISTPNVGLGLGPEIWSRRGAREPITAGPDTRRHEVGDEGGPGPVTRGGACGGCGPRGAGGGDARDRGGRTGYWQWPVCSPSSAHPAHEAHLHWASGCGRQWHCLATWTRRAAHSPHGARGHRPEDAPRMPQCGAVGLGAPVPRAPHLPLLARVPASPLGHIPLRGPARQACTPRPSWTRPGLGPQDSTFLPGWLSVFIGSSWFPPGPPGCQTPPRCGRASQAAPAAPEVLERPRCRAPPFGSHTGALGKASPLASTSPRTLGDSQALGIPRMTFELSPAPPSLGRRWPGGTEAKHLLLGTGAKAKGPRGRGLGHSGACSAESRGSRGRRLGRKQGPGSSAPCPSWAGFGGLTSGIQGSRLCSGF